MNWNWKIAAGAGVATLVVGVIIFFVVRHRGGSSQSSVVHTPQAETSNSQGAIGNWGPSQKEDVKVMIAKSLLATQTNVSHVAVPLAQFMSTTTGIGNCLSCLVEHFSAKYSYADVTARVQSAGKDADFDKWFQSLYGVCDCNDKLGILLTELLKKYWVQEVAKTCNNSAGKKAQACISDVHSPDFSQGAVTGIYNDITSCIQQGCPSLVDAVGK